MTENSADTTSGRWEQLNKCPTCGADMSRAAQVGEQIGLYYRCAEHGRFRYSWDHDRLEAVPEREE
jgi:predicted RNA-binding Zn-ribbon protein involved in translation (DUF1610 family)